MHLAKCYLHRIMRTTILTAASTNAITITATPVSRLGSENGLAPGSVDGLAPGGSVDELAPMSVDGLVPGSVDDGLAPGSADGLASRSVDELRSSSYIQTEGFSYF